MDKVSELLQRFGLSRTTLRVKIIELFLKSEYALSEAEIRNLLGENTDRTTVFRTLKTFEKEELIYRLGADDGVVKFFINSHVDSSTLHEHLHFRCEKCKKLMCLEGNSIAPYTLPKGFLASKNNFIVVGVCAHCS